jgi:hypothetical protein
MTTRGYLNMYKIGFLAVSQLGTKEESKNEEIKTFCGPDYESIQYITSRSRSTSHHTGKNM